MSEVLGGVLAVVFAGLLLWGVVRPEMARPPAPEDVPLRAGSLREDFTVLLAAPLVLVMGLVGVLLPVVAFGVLGVVAFAVVKWAFGVVF